MKKSFIVIVIFVFFFYFASSALAEVKVKLEKIGFPEEAAVSLAQLAEQKNFSEKIDIPKGMIVSALIREDKVETDVKLNWPGEYQFKAEKYEAGEFVLYRLINQGQEIFFRIGDLPRPIQKLETPVVFPTSPQEEKKTETPEEKTPVPIQKTGEDGVEKVYEASVLPLDLKNLADQSMTAVIFPIDQSDWIGDGLGVYVTTEKDGKEIEEVLTRKVWRAYIGREIFPAVITKFGLDLFVVAQEKTKTELLGENIVIISGSGKFALTLSGMVKFDLKKFKESEEYRNNFFEKNPSKVKDEMLVDISPNTENGKMFLSDLRKIFPNEYYVKGKLISTDTDELTLESLVSSSNNEDYLRRVIEKGGLPNISLSAIACPPCELTRILIVWTLAAFDSSLNGNFFEAKVSGRQAGKAMNRYLKELRKEMDNMKSLIKVMEVKS